MSTLKPDPVKSLLYALLVKTTRQREHLPFRLIWNRLYRYTRRWTTPISTVIHEQPVVVGFNYSYPITTRAFPTLNNPLVELVHQAFTTLGRPLRLVDVGAAIGDTVLLLEANCPAMISEYLCIDGDAQFFSYLQHNLGSLPKCRLILHQLSRERRTERALVRTKGGTASALGDTQTEVAPLDEVLKTFQAGPIDVLKIDVDGFDGEVLAGAHGLLKEQQPAVIFEWHPLQCELVGNGPSVHFQTLAAHGYRELIWFDKFGAFSHFGNSDDTAAIAQTEAYCRQTTTREDWHYDIVALPGASAIDRVKLADLAFANARRSTS